MKKDKKQSERKPKITLSKESVRKLTGPELPNVVGGQPTTSVTFAKLCCDTI